MAKTLTRDINGDGQIDQYGLSSFMGAGSLEAIHLWEVDWFNDSQTEFIGHRPENLAAITELRSLYEAGVMGGQLESGHGGHHASAAVLSEHAGDDHEHQRPFQLVSRSASQGRQSANTTGFPLSGYGSRCGQSRGSVAVHQVHGYRLRGLSAFARAENRTPLSPRAIVDFNRRWETLNPGMNAMVFTTGFEHILRANWFGLPQDIYDTIGSTMQRIMRMQQDPKSAMDALKPVLDNRLREIRDTLRKI